MIVCLVLTMIGTVQHVNAQQSQTYSVDARFEVTFSPSPNELAHAVFTDSDRSTGWNYLTITANQQVSPLQQHQAAGFLEGYATYAKIYSQFVNVAGMDFNGSVNAPPIIQNFLVEQLSWVRTMIELNPEDDFWRYAGYYLTQAEYMYRGYMARIAREGRSEWSLTWEQFYYLPSVGDLTDLIPWSQHQGVGQKPAPLTEEELNMRKNCNAYIRWDGSQLYITQATHNNYAMMLRIIKSYHFPRQGTPTKTITFTSRPGDLISKDDFFVLDSKLSVLETSLENQDPANWKEVKPKSVPSWLRTVVANHLGGSLEDWVRLFNTQRSGTHNNQWILIDKSRARQKENIIWALDEAFSLTEVTDMTPYLLTNGYIGSYNMPISEAVYKKLGFTLQKNNDYWTDPRALILARIHPKMQTINGMMHWLIQNDEEDVRVGLAPRYDLYQPRPKAFGMTDCKVSSLQTLKLGYFWAISGPTQSNGRFPPFDWRKWTHSNTSHVGQPNEFDFEWQKVFIPQS